jgi:hypothetical protein
VTTPATKKALVDSQKSILSFLGSMTATEKAVIDEKFASWAYRTTMPFNYVDCQEFKGFCDGDSTEV